MSVIRFASTVILLRETKQSTGSLLQTYTTKRPETMRFLPGFTVFPGGAIEEDDLDEKWRQMIKQNDVAKYPILSSWPTDIDLNPPQNLEFAHIVAAIREVFEETGALICQSGPQYLTPQHLSQYRTALEKNEMTFFEMIKALKIELDTKHLLSIGSRLTPPPSPIRFNTNFYLTFVPEHIKMEPSPIEVASAAWIDPSEAEEMWESQQIFCVKPTKECFKTLAQLSVQKELLHTLA